MKGFLHFQLVFRADPPQQNASTSKTTTTINTTVENARTEKVQGALARLGYLRACRCTCTNTRSKKSHRLIIFVGVP